jgi:ATP-dependent helicase YprA (DUF1998 family)
VHIIICANIISLSVQGDKTASCQRRECKRSCSGPPVQHGRRHASAARCAAHGGAHCEAGRRGARGAKAQTRQAADAQPAAHRRADGLRAQAQDMSLICLSMLSYLKVLQSVCRSDRTAQGGSKVCLATAHPVQSSGRHAPAARQSVAEHIVK